MIEMKSRFRGCMLGLGIGDSLGFPVEFIHEIESILAVTDGKGVNDLPDPAIYTDDTQMTICIANAVIESGDDMDKFMDALKREFIRWFHDQKIGEKRRAPGHTCLTACQNLVDGSSWETSGVPASTGCGSAMRAAPIGLYFDKVEKVVDYALNSSKITHPNELALCGAVGTAFLTYLAKNDEPVGCWGSELVKICSLNSEFTDLIKMAVEQAADRVDPNYVLSANCLGEGWTGHEAVASALFCCMMHPDSYEKAVLMAANTVGDSDSIACITGAWMGAKLGVDSIRPAWREKIEDKELLTTLADQLLLKPTLTEVK